MAISTISDIQIYNDQFHAGATEVLAENTNAFNASSNGAIVLTTQERRGDYKRQEFIKSIAGLITRRDDTSVSAATDLAWSSDENIDVRLKRTIGPVTPTLDELFELAQDMQEFSFLLGQQVGEAMAYDMLSSATRGLVAALGNVAALTHDYSATGTLTHTQLNVGLSKMGDASNRVVAWVMHSKVWHDLVGQAITDNIFQVGSISIFQGITPTMGRPTIVVDSAPLLDTVPAPDQYMTLGLVQNACMIEETRGRQMISEVVTGLDNLVVRMQGEFAYNLGIKGFKWDITNGGRNPADAAVATGTNWDAAQTSDKDRAGVLIITQ